MNSVSKDFFKEEFAAFKAACRNSKDDLSLIFNNAHLSVDPNIVTYLKPHQIEGIKFMLHACFVENKGCILAHCMGLGKTFQVIALLHTLLANHKVTNIRRVIVIMPKNVLFNWYREFQRWLKDCVYKINVYSFPPLATSAPQSEIRLKALQTWYENSGVLLIGYNLFARLSASDDFKRYLLSPDIVICDEGHCLKNAKTQLSKVQAKFFFFSFV